MRKLTASIHKELLLLFRDKTGLILLFFMPAFLVLIITLIQENVLKTEINVLFLDNDRERIGTEIENLLNTSDSIKLVKSMDGSDFTIDQAKLAVAEGSYQFSIIIPKGTTASLQVKSRERVKQALFPKATPSDIKETHTPDISVFFDPTIQGSFRTAIASIIERVVRGIELKLKLEQTFEMLPAKIRQTLPEEIRMHIPKEDNFLAFDTLSETSSEIIGIREKFATKMGFITQPTSVQQNVPAWTLFGIFFIVVPISGSLIKERDSGTMLKLKSMPVSYLTIMLGKIFAYIMICFCQFAVILLIGKIILPLFGSPAFEIGASPGLFFLILMSSICAATGYGIMLGTVLKSYEQASMFGPVSIVIAAAIGGIMVPVYTMPDFIQPFCVLSPLSWGQNAFYDILLRGGDITSVYPEITSLFAFFITNLVIAFFFILGKDLKISR